MADEARTPALLSGEVTTPSVITSSKPWDRDVKMWGEQRAYSWWLQQALPLTLRDLTHRDARMAQALRVVLHVHAPRRSHQSVGAGAACAACTTGIRSFGDDGPSDHRVEWPCAAIVGIAVALDIGPAEDDRHYRYMLPKLVIDPAGNDRSSDA